MEVVINRQSQPTICAPKPIRPSIIKKGTVVGVNPFVPSFPCNGNEDQASQFKSTQSHQHEARLSSRPPSVAGFQTHIKKQTSLEKLANVSEDYDENEGLRRMAEAEKEFSNQQRLFCFPEPCAQVAAPMPAYKPKPLRKSNLCPFTIPSRPSNPMATDCLFIKQVNMEEQCCRDNLSIASLQTRDSYSSYAETSSCGGFESLDGFESRDYNPFEYNQHQRASFHFTNSQQVFPNQQVIHSPFH